MSGPYFPNHPSKKTTPILYIGVAAFGVFALLFAGLVMESAPQTSTSPPSITPTLAPISTPASFPTLAVAPPAPPAPPIAPTAIAKSSTLSPAGTQSQNAIGDVAPTLPPTPTEQGPTAPSGDLSAQVDSLAKDTRNCASESDCTALSIAARAEAHKESQQSRVFFINGQPRQARLYSSASRALFQIAYAAEYFAQAYRWQPIDSTIAANHRQQGNFSLSMAQMEASF